MTFGFSVKLSLRHRREMLGLKLRHCFRSHYFDMKFKMHHFVRNRFHLFIAYAFFLSIFDCNFVWDTIKWLRKLCTLRVFVWLVCCVFSMLRWCILNASHINTYFHLLFFYVCCLHYFSCWEFSLPQVWDKGFSQTESFRITCLHRETERMGRVPQSTFLYNFHLIKFNVLFTHFSLALCVFLWFSFRFQNIWLFFVEQNS